jgi:hypothetical protein
VNLHGLAEWLIEIGVQFALIPKLEKFVVGFGGGTGCTGFLLLVIILVRGDIIEIRKD